MYFVPLRKRGAKNCKKSAGLQIIRKYDMQPGFFAGFDSLAFPFGNPCRYSWLPLRGLFLPNCRLRQLRQPAVGDSRLKRSSPVVSSLGASRHSPRRGKQENDELPEGEAEDFGEKVPPKKKEAGDKER